MLLQGGIFGLGPNSSLNQWDGRDDVSIQLIWQLENLGIRQPGADQGPARQESQAIIDLRKAQDRVAEEVNQAQAHFQSAAARVVQADRALRTGHHHLERASRGSEADQPLRRRAGPDQPAAGGDLRLQLLMRAFDEYFTTVAEYNRAQFELFHAWATRPANSRTSGPPGDAVPVDTSRPSYLPPVGNGPPPASH